MRVLCSVFLLMALVACKGGGGDSVTSGSSSINGIYQSCEYDSDNDFSTRSTIYVNQEMISEVIRYYSGSGCSAGNEEFEDRATYSYTKISSGYRLAFVGLTMTSLSANDQAWNNTNSYCGFNNWTQNLPKIVLGADCDGNTINAGDYMDVQVRKSGSSLVVKAPGGSFTYASIGPWSFANQGQTVADGTWYYNDGSYGAILVTNAGSYTMTYLDPTGMKYFTATGTYTSANNVVNTTVVSYSPDCADDEGTTYAEKFTQTNFSLAIQGETANEGTLFEKLPLSNAQMISVFANGYTAGCF